MSKNATKPCMKPMNHQDYGKLLNVTKHKKVQLVSLTGLKKTLLPWKLIKAWKLRNCIFFQTINYTSQFHGESKTRKAIGTYTVMHGDCPFISCCYMRRITRGQKYVAVISWTIKCNHLQESLCWEKSMMSTDVLWYELLGAVTVVVSYGIHND